MKRADSKEIAAPWVSFSLGLSAQKTGLAAPPRQSQAEATTACMALSVCRSEDSPCRPSEGVPWPPAAGCEPGVLMAILVALRSRKALPLFLGT